MRPFRVGKHKWEDRDARFVRDRYNSIAGFITFFEWLLFVPQGFREKAVNTLDLKQGQCALEIGCGTGRNLQFIHRSVGDSGRIYGVDLSEAMLDRARALSRDHDWRNVELVLGDATAYVAPEPLDAVLFGFSYNTMPNHEEALSQAWKQLKPGGALVIMDAKLPPGVFGRIVLPFRVWLMKNTLLGNPHVRPWEHVAVLDPNLKLQEFRGGAYYICRATKPCSQSISYEFSGEKTDVRNNPRNRP